MTNATFVDVPRKYPATTLVWEVDPVIGVDKVRLHISRVVDYSDEKMYHLDPITTNRNEANMKKYIYIRMAYYPITSSNNAGKVDKLYKHYVLDYLLGCNVDIVKDDQVDYSTIEWGCVVLDF